MSTSKKIIGTGVACVERVKTDADPICQTVWEYDLDAPARTLARMHRR